MSKKQAINFDLSEIADGGVQVKLNRALQKVAENVLDPNTDPKKKRKVQEVAQPASKFIFRMREGMLSALFMADNNQWQVEAKKNIKDFIQQLEQETFEEIKFPVIA